MYRDTDSRGGFGLGKNYMILVQNQNQNQYIWARLLWYINIFTIKINHHWNNIAKFAVFLLSHSYEITIFGTHNTGYMTEHILI